MGNYDGRVHNALNVMTATATYSDQGYHYAINITDPGTRRKQGTQFITT